MFAVLIPTLIVTWLAFTMLWAVSLRKTDASIVDIYWGPGFAVIGVVASLTSKDFSSMAWLLLGAIAAWGLRLGYYMKARHRGVEDPRYKAMRDRNPDFGRQSLWLVFWLQAFIQWLAASPILAVAISPDLSPGWIALAGFLLFAAGFGIEIAADEEVARFRADPANKGQLLTSGLHGFVRHPNYLGEIMLQWGFGFIAFGITLNAYAFLGPALMTGLIVKLSGIPLLEAEFAKRPGFEEWKQRTGALFPKLGSSGPPSPKP